MMRLLTHFTYCTCNIYTSQLEAADHYTPVQSPKCTLYQNHYTLTKGDRLVTLVIAPLA